MTIHVGILGAGNISETHARAASEIDGVEVAAVYGQNAPKSSRLAERYSAPAYQKLEDFLNHKPLDLVAIGSPSGVHAQEGIAAARRGLHVLTEKPIDVTTERADQLIDECQKAGVKLGVFFQDRVKSDTRRLKEIIEGGVIGKPILATAHVKWYRPPDYYSGSRWRGTWKLDGGGALMNQGIHTVDLLLWLLGQVDRVYARSRTALHKIEVEDVVVAVLEFANGAVATLEASTAAYPGYPRRLEISGSEGTIILEQDQILSADLLNPLPSPQSEEERDRNLSASSPVVSDVRGHRKLLEDFIQAIQTDGKPCCDGQEGRRSVELVQAVYESARTGKAVEVGRRPEA